MKARELSLQAILKLRTGEIKIIEQALGIQLVIFPCLSVFLSFLWKMDIWFYMPKMKNTIQTVQKPASVMTAWVICIYVKVPLMRRHWCWNFGDVCSRQDDDFPQELHVYFSRTMPDLILHEFATAWCRSVCAWMACLQSRSVSYWKCVVHHEEENHTKVTTDCSSSPSLVYTKNGQRFHLQNCNNWYLQFPNDYKV